MQVSTAKDELIEKALAIEDDEFEQLCKMLVESVETPAHIELTPFGGDGGIDVRGCYGQELYEPWFGVQSKKHQNNVTAPAMRNFVGALRQHHYQWGVFITTSGYSSNARELANEQKSHPITLLDADSLTDVMLQYEVGVVEVSTGEYNLDPAFWTIFEKTTSGNPVKTEEVPQADSLEVLRFALKAIDQGYRYKPEITDFMERKTGDGWTGRQADYYPLAGYALGYVHKDTMGEFQGQRMRRWGLTREGQEYIELLESGDEEAAKEHLCIHIDGMEITQRILAVIEQETEIPHSRLKELVLEESELNETTANRRASTLGQWISELPQIRRKGHGPSLRYEYVSKNLDDYP